MNTNPRMLPSLQSEEEVLALPPGERGRALQKLIINTQGFISIQTQLKFFELPPNERKEVILEFIRYKWLGREAVQKLFDLPSDERKVILPKYAYRYRFHYNEAVKIFNLPTDERRIVLTKFIFACRDMMYPNGPNDLLYELRLYFLALPHDELQDILDMSYISLDDINTSRQRESRFRGDIVIF